MTKAINLTIAHTFNQKDGIIVRHTIDGNNVILHRDTTQLPARANTVIRELIHLITYGDHSFDEQAALIESLLTWTYAYHEDLARD